MKQSKFATDILKAYSTLAAATLAAVSADAQVTIIDIDPDRVIESGDFFELDVNADAETDLVIFNALVSASVFNSQNFFASHGSVAGSVADVDGYFFLLASEFGLSETIGASDYWVAGVGVCYFNLLGGDGQWENSIDKFAGFRLENGSDYNYGWVRMDITQDPFLITVKDIGYNVTVDESVVTEIPVSILATETQPAQIFLQENILYVQLKENITDARLVLYNMNGERLLEDQISDDKKIDLTHFLPGVYLVSLFMGDEVFTTKQVVK